MKKNDRKMIAGMFGALSKLIINAHLENRLTQKKD